MAVSKVSLEILSQMANTLRQSAEAIVSAKGEMDEQLRSFVWDDPVGQSFAIKYEEDFKPLTNKLLPSMNEYVTYIIGLEGNVAEYGGTASMIGTIGAAMKPKRSTGISEGHVSSAALAGRLPKGKGVLAKEKIVSLDEDPTNVDLSQDDYEKLKKRPEYKRRYEAYLSELRKRRPDLSKRITAADIDQINSAVLNLKDDELIVKFDRLGASDVLGGQATGEHASINRDFLDWNPESSRCGVGALGAHESTHAAQWKKYRKIFDKAQIDPSSLTPGEKKILESYPKIFKGWSEAYHNSLEEIDARISQYAFRDACNQYAVETYYTK